MAGLIFKLLFKAMVPLCIIFGIMSYLSYLNGGNPASIFEGMGSSVMAKFNDVKQAVGQLPEKVSEVIGDKNEEKGAGSKRTFYKWQDASGAWHYSEESPDSDNVSSLSGVSVRGNENIIQAIKLPKVQT